MGQIGLFDTENILNALSEHGDPLEKLDETIQWHIFKPILLKAFKKERKNNAGRPPYDYIMMFKIIVLQHLYNLSDSQMQFQLLDRYSFKRFIGLNKEDTIPDEKTIWLFREHLTQRNVIEKLFKKFNTFLDMSGFKAQKGMIVDAGIVEVPKQRNSRDENKQIKAGKVPAAWKEKVSKLRQKDVDARWLKKHGENYYGYKDHLCVDVKHKLIRKYSVTSANVHDSEELFNLIDNKNTNQTLWADSAYDSEDTSKRLKKRSIKNRIHAKGCRYKPLSEFQKNQNRRKSTTRARVEHVFGRIAHMYRCFIRCIGQLRAAARIGITNLVYNMTRYQHLVTHT